MTRPHQLRILSAATNERGLPRKESRQRFLGHKACFLYCQSSLWQRAPSDEGGIGEVVGSGASGSPGPGGGVSGGGTRIGPGLGVGVSGFGSRGSGGVSGSGFGVEGVGGLGVGVGTGEGGSTG